MKNDEENVLLAQSTASVDSINAKFYGRFQYPWPPQAFFKLSDPDFEAKALNQSIGSWSSPTIPTDARIWVAGCGTNQAVFTALRFPKASILGTDLSANSLEVAANNARALGISNLELKQESLNHTQYIEAFDYIICTGVIHHNSNPRESLQVIARAIKRDGVLELMVYNRYHRILTTAFQKAIRAFGGDAANGEFEQELMITKKIMEGMELQNLMVSFIESCKNKTEADLADSLLQPVEYSFTIESLHDLVDACGLELLLPCISQVDKAAWTLDWNMKFADPGLQRQYDSFPDLQRWRISNHLMLERSPMLWFYVGRKDSGRTRKSESQLCLEFLDQRFEKSRTVQHVFSRTEDGRYVEAARTVSYPGVHGDAQCRRVIDSVESQGSKSMGELLGQIHIGTTFPEVNSLRLRLTTSMFPYLMSRPEQS